MSEIVLRPYQKDFVGNVRNEFVHRHKRVVGVAPCGSGKTVMAAYMVRGAVSKGNRVIFLVHRDELIAQTAHTFAKFGIEFGVIAAGTEMRTDIPVQIASVQTLSRRLDKVNAPDFIICDECHHILAKTYRKIIDAFPNARLLGLTATPQRMGGVTLGDVFDSMVESLSVNQLIKLGCLSKFDYFSADVGVDLSHVRKHFGEYVNSDIEAVMSDKKIIGGIVENYLKYAGGKQAICYCVNVAHSQKVADAFNEAGIKTAHVDGNTDKQVRKYFVEQFRVGKIKVLCNAELFSEGFDVPNCQCVILARPTNSLTLYIQQAMRALRRDPTNPNKIAVIIDHVRNYVRHGLPNKIHNWRLLPEVYEVWRLCKICNKKVLPFVDKDGNDVCPKCGEIIPPPEKQMRLEEPDEQPEFDTTEHDGNLQKIETPDDDGDQAPKIKHAPRTPEEFLAAAKELDYKIGWAAYQSLNFANSYADCLHIARVVGYKDGWAWHKWQQRKAEISSKKALQNARLSC